MLAAIRPDDVNLPLFLHVLGAMLLVGTLFAVAAATAIGWRRSSDTAGLTSFSLRTLLIGVLPSYILMRIGASGLRPSRTIRTVSTRPGSVSATSRPTSAPC